MRLRRQVLEEEVDGYRLILPARRLADDGLAAWQEVLARGYGGLVGKHPEAQQGPGRHAPLAQGTVAPLPETPGSPW